jgi:hypothetical protein
MDRLKFARGLGKMIIEAQHDYFKAGNSQDLEHITNIKRIIAAISGYLDSDGLTKDWISAMAEDLRQLSKKIFVESCISNKYEDEDYEVVRAESETWFDYIYENEEYPR